MLPLNPVDLIEMNSISWFHRIDLGGGIITPGACPHTAEEATKRFGIPLGLEGKRVLDIGAWDGLFSFEAERRGATVIAMDTDQEHGGNWGGTRGFNFVKTHLGSNVEFVSCSVYDLDPASLPTIDIVFFFGVLYHLENPIEALKRVFKITGEYCLIETAYCFHQEGGSRAFWEFAPMRDNDPTNYWYPTLKGLDSMLRFVGFKEIHLIYVDQFRVTMRAMK